MKPAQRNNAMTDDHQMAALREEIRGAGHDTRLMRLGSAASLLILVVGLLLLAFGIGEGYSVRPPSITVVLLNLAIIAGGGCIVALAVAMVGAAVVRWGRRTTIRPRLASMAPHERAEVLRGLAQDPIGDTRKLARSLARSVGVSTELSPALPPGARGDEASPAERTR